MSRTRKSRITIPDRIRKYLGLAPGNRSRSEVKGDGVRMVHVVSRLEENFANVAPRNRPEDFRRIREEFEKGVGEEAGGES